jgi:uncharacterized SAM-binding protein YcdF (DUF218 family)
MGLSSALVPVLKLLVLPPGGIIVLAVLGLVALRRRPRLGKALCGMALGLLYVLSTGVGSWLLVHPLESLEPALASGATPAAAIVVLTAGASATVRNTGAGQSLISRRSSASRMALICTASASYLCW